MSVEKLIAEIGQIPDTTKPLEALYDVPDKIWRVGFAWDVADLKALVAQRDKLLEIAKAFDGFLQALRTATEGDGDLTVYSSPGGRSYSTQELQLQLGQAIAECTEE